MSLLFKRSVIERVPEVYAFAKGEHVDLGPSGYKIAITALLGFTPTAWETDEVFRQRNSLSLTELRDIVNYKLSFLYIEQYMDDMFSKFDGNFKGYITLQDVRTTWEQVQSEISWSKIRDCFVELTKGDTMDYSTFCDMILNSENRKEINLNNMYLFNKLGIHK